MDENKLSDMISQAVSKRLDEMATSKVTTEEDAEIKAPEVLLKRTAEPERKSSPKEPGIGAARIVRALAFGKGDPSRAQFFGKEMVKRRAWDDELGDRVNKALAASTFTAGGFMVPEDFVQEIIDLLRPRSIVRAAGCPTIPMMRGTLTMPKATGDITAAYVGENKPIAKSEPTGGQLVLSAKKLAALVPLSNDLLDFAPGNAADMFVRNSIVKQIATREDRAFIRDDGTQYTPKGIRYWVTSGNVVTTNGNNAADVEYDFRDMLNKLEQANVSMDSPVWFMAPRTKNHLLTLRDGNGLLIYPSIRDPQPTIHGYPVFVSTNIPTNLGGGANEAEIYLVNMSDMLIAESGAMEITVDTSASYTDGGSLVSAFERDQTVIRAITRHDFGALHEESIAVCQVAWDV